MTLPGEAYFHLTISGLAALAAVSVPCSPAAVAGPPSSLPPRAAGGWYLDRLSQLLPAIGRWGSWQKSLGCRQWGRETSREAFCSFENLTFHLAFFLFLPFLLASFLPDPSVISVVLRPPCVLFSPPGMPLSSSQSGYPDSSFRPWPSWGHVSHLLSPSLLHSRVIPCLFTRVVWHVAGVGGITQPVPSPMPSRRDLPKERALHTTGTSH